MATTQFTDGVTLIQSSWLNSVDTATYTALSAVAGTNTITATGPNSLTAYLVGQRFVFIPANSNSGATTLNINSLGPVNVFFNGAACAGGELRATFLYEVVHDGTQFNILALTALKTQSANTIFAGPGSGSAAAPTFRTPVGADGASEVFLGSATAAVSASLVFTSLLSATYDEYVLKFVNLLPATDAQNMLLRYSTDNGSTYKSGASDYQYYSTGINQAGTGITPVSAGASAILFASGVSNLAADGGVNGHMHIYGVNSTTAKKGMTCQVNTYSSTTGGQVQNGGGISILAGLSTAAVNALQIIMGSGNLTSGTVYLYGIRKA